MANESNLKPWQPGQSGNPAGKPKGTKHLSTYIREMMEDESFAVNLNSGQKFVGAPIRALVIALITQALEGDTKAFSLLAKYGYDMRAADIPVNGLAAPIVYLPKELPTSIVAQPRNN